MSRQDDELLSTLAEVETEVEQSEEALREVKHRARFLRRERSRGRPVRQLLREEPRPRSMELLASATERLRSASARLRRSKMRSLRAEGASVNEIAELFGVTHQRVSALLRANGEAADTGATADS
jgi:chromosome segregation ATPase